MQRTNSTRRKPPISKRAARPARSDAWLAKKRLSETLNAGLEPIRTERARWAAKISDVKEILIDGSKKAGAIAQATIALVRDAVKLSMPEGATKS